MPELSGTTEFRYLEGEQAYEVVLPGLVAGRLETTNISGNWSSNIVRQGNMPGTQQARLDLLRPAPPTNLIELTYTSFGIWGSGEPSQPGAHTGGIFTYGVPTAEGDVPTVGVGRFKALVSAITLDTGEQVGGEARLVFDFGAGSLTGNMNVVLDNTWDESGFQLNYDFAETVFGVGNTTFSGRFVVPGTTENSFFEGQFTGPQAAELMARWSAPYLSPFSNQWARMQGVWVGRRE